MVKNKKPSDFRFALLLMAPAGLVFIIFTYYPFLQACWYSICQIDHNTFQPVKIIGLKYFERIFNIGKSGFGDEYIKSILTSFQFTICVVPAEIVLSVFFAILTAKKFKFVGSFKTIFTLGVAISLASASVIWSIIFSPNLKLFGSLNILNDARTALFALTIVTIWSSLGFNYLFALAGLRSISKDLLESAKVDGAGRLRTLFHITLPLLGPTLLFLLIINTIACLQAFTQFKILINGPGPDGSTNVLIFSLFNAFWIENNYGLASALSVILFILILIFTIFQFRLDKKVHYQ